MLASSTFSAKRAVRDTAALALGTVTLSDSDTCVRYSYSQGGTTVQRAISVSGGTLTLTWPDSHRGWILEGQTNSLSVGISNNFYIFLIGLLLSQ